VKKEDILTAGGAKAGDKLLLLYDKVGKRGTSYELGWDSVTDRSSEEVIQRLSVMNDLADKHLVNASKDVSVAGIVGTAGMLLEYSGKGGVLDISALNDFRPPEIPLEDWLRMYISLGFLVSASPDRVSKVNEIAIKHGVMCIVVGLVDDTKCFQLQRGDYKTVMFDFSKGPILTPQ
jgi:hypothetical protein